jgi:DNA-binding transcriptional MocR family regulator
MPNVKYFPFDTLEAQISKPDRWQPSSNYPEQIEEPSPEPAPPAPTSSISGFINHINKKGKNMTKDPDAHKKPTRITIPKVLDETDPTKRIDLATALQYGQVTGYPPLLSFIKQFTNQVLYPDIPYKGGVDVILNNGSTDGFSKVLQLLVDPWYEGLHPTSERQGMLCETFVFGNIITQAKPLGINIVPVEIDDQGMVAEGPGGLREVLENWDPQNGLLPHFLYTVT